MQAVWSALIAVVGTLSGSFLTHVFARWNSERAEKVAREERLREERTAAILAFSENVTDLRRANYDRWHRQHYGSSNEILMDAANEYYRLRSGAEKALLHVQIVANIPELICAGHESINATTSVHNAKTADEAREVGDSAQGKINEFIAIASNKIWPA